MSEIDEWFSSLTKKQKLTVLGYSRNWNYNECSKMSVEELIVLVEFPPKSIDNSIPECPVRELYDLYSITDDMYLDMWNKISIEGKEQIQLNFESL